MISRTKQSPGQIEASTGTDPQGNTHFIPISGPAKTDETPMSAGETRFYEFDHQGYGGMLYIIRSDQNSASGGISLEFSNDGEVWFPAGVMITYNTPNIQIQRALVPKRNYSRFRYQNGSAAQTFFSFEIRLSVENIQPTLSSLNIPVTPTVLANITKAVIELPDDSGTQYKQIGRVDDAMKVSVVNQSEVPESLMVNNLPQDYAKEAGNLLNTVNKLTEIITKLSNGTQTVQIVDGNNQTRGIDNLPLKVQYPANYVPPVTPVTLSGNPSVTLSNPTDVSTLSKETTLQAVLAKIITAPSTEAKQDAIIALLNTLSGKDYATQTTLASVLAKLNGSIAVTGTFFQQTQPVSAATLPLPVGASTSALQTSGNTSLSNIDTDLRSR